jgi:Fe-S cluster assembly protein SufD
MSAVLEFSSRYTATYDDLREHLPGQHLPWLQQLRADALNAFAGQGFPTLRDEEWKYTNVSALEKKLFAPVFESEVIDPDPTLYESLILEDCWRVVLSDGHFSAALSQLDGLPEDVFIGSISDALKQIPEQVKAYLGKAVAGQDHGFIHFNNAWFVDGLFV